jgi:PHD/YefM family antitoxin component YafN of YafNO toxin-antitoxin module
MTTDNRKPVAELTDEELFDELREQVNLSRSNPNSYDRKRTREIGAEMQKRGWK